MSNPQTVITQATAKLASAIQEHEAAKLNFRAAMAALGKAQQAMETAHAIEVDAHDELQTAITARRKSRRA